MSKYNKDKDFYKKLYNKQVVKTIHGGGNSNTIGDYIVSVFSNSRRKQVNTINKANIRGKKIKVEIEHRKQNNLKVGSIIGNNKEKDSKNTLKYSDNINYGEVDWSEIEISEHDNTKNINVYAEPTITDLIFIILGGLFCLILYIPAFCIIFLVLDFIYGVFVYTYHHGIKSTATEAIIAIGILWFISAIIRR